MPFDDWICCSCLIEKYLYGRKHTLYVCLSLSNCHIFEVLPLSFSILHSFFFIVNVWCNSIRSMLIQWFLTLLQQTAFTTTSTTRQWLLCSYPLSIALSIKSGPIVEWRLVSHKFHCSFVCQLPYKAHRVGFFILLIRMPFILLLQVVFTSLQKDDISVLAAARGYFL